MFPTRQIAVTIVTVVLAASLSTLAVVLITRFIGGPALSISQVTTNKQSSFDVTGEAKMITVPDQAEVRMGISVNESTVKVAQDKANTVINDINARLAELGIEKKDVKTENYSLNPNYDFTSGTQRITGYSVNANLNVTMKDFAKLNQAVDLATAAGANQIGGITFTLSDDKKAEVEKQAREEAIADAKDNASELAGLAGMKLGKIINIIESPQPGNDLYPRDLMSATMEGKGGAGGVPTNIEPGSATYNYTVTLSYETL